MLAVLLAAGCSSGDRPLDQVDPDAVAANPTYDQVYAIIYRSCIPCHGGEGEAADAAGPLAAASDVTPINDCSSIVALRVSILETAEDNTMPPGAWTRLTSEEKLTIRRWIDNGAPAPCNP